MMHHLANTHYTTDPACEKTQDGFFCRLAGPVALTGIACPFGKKYKCNKKIGSHDSPTH